MTEEDSRDTPVSIESSSMETERLKADIERSRTELSTTIGELESRLSPPEIRSLMRAELEHVEQRVRATVKDELGEARKAVHDGLDEAEAKIRRGVADAKTAIQRDVSDALT